MGVNLLTDLKEKTAARISEDIMRVREPRDIVVLSVHWGPNWGYSIPDEERRFARAIIDKADVSIIHGHSSHHAKAVEVYRDRLILYGCGDFLNDYEGIRGYEEYRNDLALMYFADIDGKSKDLVSLEIVPLQIRQFRLFRASNGDIAWLQQMLDRESAQFGTRFSLTQGRLQLSGRR
jgi:poly-gamma-glutamate synthesis protein (capsule biosynthesis protein)